MWGHRSPEAIPAAIDDPAAVRVHYNALVTGIGLQGQAPPAGMRILDRLLAEGRIDQSDYESVILHAQRIGTRAEDALIDCGVMSEMDLLKYLAAVYRTRYVGTEKLANANVTRATLKLVPHKAAEKLLVFPVLWDPATSTLSVVAADLAIGDLAKQVQLVTNVRDVRVYVARPGAVIAAIRKYYVGEVGAFAMMLGSGGRSVQEEREQLQGARDIPLDDEPDVPVSEWLESPAVSAHAQQTRTKRDLVIEAPEIAADLAKAPQAATPEAAAPRAAASPSGVSVDDYLEMLHVMVALLEQGRGELRGHTSLVARLCKKVCERIGLPKDQTTGISIAAHLHDIGKASAYHLTALNVAQYEGHRIQAQKTYLTPIRMFESANLPEIAIESLAHMYERYDGQGFPDRLSGKEIPLGSRILAIVETYADITTHPKNPYRKALDAKEACEALGQFEEAFFDPNLLDVFESLVLGDDLRSRLLEDRRTVLLVDPDPEDSTVLEMRLIEHGHDVVIARNAADAIARFEKGGIDAIVSEVDIGGEDGFELVARLRKDGGDVPVLFLTRRGDRASVNRGFELGAADYLVKPASADVVAAKVQKALERRAEAKSGRGVTGSLREMSLPDVIQILSNGRKSGQLSIRANGRVGQLWFGDGFIHDARFGDVRGEEAVYAMLLLQDGDFVLDPNAPPTERVIRSSTESLLLEGMRRMDEGNR